MNAAATSHLGPVTLRGEWARSFVDGAPFEEGMYAQLAVEAGDVVVPSLRYDQVLHFQGPTGDTRAAIAGLQFRAMTFWNLRVESVVDLDTLQTEFHAMSAFFF